jgi:hypothetical protein
LTCTLSSADERKQILSELQLAGIPSEHVSVSPPEKPDDDEGHSSRDSGFMDWPIADAILCGCIAGAFGAYVGLISRFIPGLDSLTTLGPSSIILGSAVFGTAFGGITALIIKAFWPDHEAQQNEADSGISTRILIIRPADIHEAQMAQKVLLVTGHAQGLRIIDPNSG